MVRLEMNQPSVMLCGTCRDVAANIVPKSVRIKA